MFNLNPASLKSFILKFNLQLPVTRSRTHSHSLWKYFVVLTEAQMISFSFYFNFDICLLVTFCIVQPQFGNRLQKLQPQHPTRTQVVPVQNLSAAQEGEDEASTNLDVSQVEDNHAKQSGTKPC